MRTAVKAMLACVMFFIAGMVATALIASVGGPNGAWDGLSLALLGLLALTGSAGIWLLGGVVKMLHYLLAVYGASSHVSLRARRVTRVTPQTPSVIVPLKPGKYFDNTGKWIGDES